MRRRALLSTVATGTAAMTAGCGVLGGSCGPGEQEISALSNQLDTGTAPDSVQIEGTATQYLDPPQIDVTGQLLVIDDGTGRAVAYPPRSFAFNPDQIDVGTCLTIDGPLNQSRSRTLELPVVMIRSENQVDTNGSGSAGEEFPTGPNANFEYEWTQAQNYDGIAVTLHHRRGQSVPARELLIKGQGNHGSGEMYWHEIADDVSENGTVSEGDSIYVGSERGGLVWEYNGEWRRPLVLWPPDRWRISFA